MNRTFLFGLLAGVIIGAASPLVPLSARRLHALSATTFKVIRNP